VIPALARAELFTEQWWRTDGVIIAIVLVVAIVISRLGTLAVRRFRKRMEGSPTATDPLQARRVATVATTLVTVIRVVVWSIAILIILGALGINLGPLLASAGIAGIAISFGAQSLIKDFFSGFFILLEDQFAVGDTIEFTLTAGSNSIVGRVENLTMRATSVRALDGTLAITGNGNILAVRNRSRGEGELFVDVQLPAGTNADEARARLDEAVARLRSDPDLQRLLGGGPSAVAVVPQPDGSIAVRVSAIATASRRGRAEEELRRRLQTALLSPTGDGAGGPASA